MAFDYGNFVSNCYWDKDQECYVAALTNSAGNTHVSILHPERALLSIYKTFIGDDFAKLINWRFRPLQEDERAKLLLFYVGTAE